MLGKNKYKMTILKAILITTPTSLILYSMSDYTGTYLEVPYLIRLLTAWAMAVMLGFFMGSIIKETNQS